MRGQWTPERVARFAAKRPAVFWRRVDQSGGPDACWPWTGRSAWNGGYGMVSLYKHRRRAHRVAYELAVGPIPAGLEVMHACDNPPCCNPAHLSVGTHADNMADMSAKGRTGRRPKLGPPKPKREPITACVKGHAYTEANTYWDRLRHRHCRTCHRIQENGRNRRLGVPPARHLTPEHDALIRQYAAEGLSQVAIGKLLGFHPSVICRRVAALGIAPFIADRRSDAFRRDRGTVAGSLLTRLRGMVA